MNKHDFVTTIKKALSLYGDKISVFYIRYKVGGMVKRFYFKEVRKFDNQEVTLQYGNIIATYALSRIMAIGYEC